MVEPLPRWDYRSEEAPSENRLAELGAQGWEFAGFDPADRARALFKRPALGFVERVTLEQRANYYRQLGRDPDTGEPVP